MSGEKKDERKLTEADRCRIAGEIAFDEFLRGCNVNGGGEVKKEVFKTLGLVLGFEDKESNDLSEECKIVLEKGVSKSLCADFKEVRKFVMCLCWKIIEERRSPFREAMREAWAETKRMCADVEAYI